MHAYDLSRLQKPVGPDDPRGMAPQPMSMSMTNAAPPPMNEPRREWDEMPRMGESSQSRVVYFYVMKILMDIYLQ